MSLKYAVLGFLSLRALSGYELKKVFDESVRHFWPADQSQIYRTLKQMHEDGLISQQVIPREERLDVKLYEITAAGQEDLQAWLSTPLSPSETREPFLIQLYFAFLLPDSQVIKLLEAEIRQTEDLLASYEAVHQATTGQAQATDMERPWFYSMLTLEFGIKANLWYRDWLRGVKERVEAGELAVQSFAQLLASIPPRQERII